MGVLYIAATPIGNLEDITFRAVETFKNADFIACEDTRRTLALLTHFGIRKPLVSCRARNEAAASEKIVKILDEGKTVVYASDAGTPCLSDPGSILVKKAREAGHKIVPVPGVSAFAAMLSIAGTYDKTVIFEGFLSPKQGRRKKRLSELFSFNAAVVLYESPYRILKLLQDIAEIDNTRKIIVGRELTKIHEEIIIGTVGEILENLERKPSIKGEFSVFISAEA